MRNFMAPTFLGSASGPRDNTADPGHVLIQSGGGMMNWVVPDGVYEISMALIGTGGNSANRSIGPSGRSRGGGGADLRWVNNVRVTPGQVLRVSRGTNSSTHGIYGDSMKVSFDGGATWPFLARGGDGGRATDGVNLDTSTALGVQSSGPLEGLTVGGGNGGTSPIPSSTGNASGGGGAGGYSGNGGNGAASNVAAGNGAGGGGAGGRGASSGGAVSGGGVGIMGQGNSGTDSTTLTTQGGSGGGNGTRGDGGNGIGSGNFGSGAGGYQSTSTTTAYVIGGLGVLRILWGKGSMNGGRAFPSTKVASATA